MKKSRIHSAPAVTRFVILPCNFGDLLRRFRTEKPFFVSIVGRAFLRTRRVSKPLFIFSETLAA